MWKSFTRKAGAAKILRHYGNRIRTFANANLRKDWIVDEAKMQQTNDAIFMHCLPVRRNVIVTDARD